MPYLFFGSVTNSTFYFAELKSLNNYLSNYKTFISVFSGNTILIMYYIYSFIYFMNNKIEFSTVTSHECSLLDKKLIEVEKLVNEVKKRNKIYKSYLTEVERFLAIGVKNLKADDINKINHYIYDINFQGIVLNKKTKFKTVKGKLFYLKTILNDIILYYNNSFKSIEFSINNINIDLDYSKTKLLKNNIEFFLTSIVLIILVFLTSFVFLSPFIEQSLNRSAIITLVNNNKVDAELILVNNSEAYIKDKALNNSRYIINMSEIKTIKFE